MRRKEDQQLLTKVGIKGYRSSERTLKIGRATKTRARVDDRSWALIGQSKKR